MTYGYDAANQLTSVTDWNANATTYAYDDAGRMTTATLPSGTGIVSTYTYDDADRLTGIDHVKGGSTTLAFVDYMLDDVGNRTQRVDGQGTHTYAYDDLYRLTSVIYPGPSTTTYAFDAFGNRTEMTNGSGTTNYTYDDADRLVEVGKPGPVSVLYDWDDNGNLVERGSDTFAWDYEDRMVSATVNSIASTFAYRGDGLRHSRTTGMTTTTFTWDIASGLPTVIDDGNQYVYGAAGLNAMRQGGNWYYYLADGLGSTMAIVNASGVVQNSYTYDVYGEPSVTGALANEFDFAGQQTDSTGLQYLRARYMDPETGTFLSRDPMASGPTWRGSHYGYADAGPCNKTDPTGRSPIKKIKNEFQKNACKSAFQGIVNTTQELLQKASEWWAGKLGRYHHKTWTPTTEAWRKAHYREYNSVQRGLNNSLQIWDNFDCDDDDIPPGGDPEVFTLAEYFRSFTLDAGAKNIDEKVWWTSLAMADAQISAAAAAAALAIALAGSGAAPIFFYPPVGNACHAYQPNC